MNTDEQESQNVEQQGETETSQVTPEYQKEIMALIENATIPELEFVISEATDLKKKMMKSQNKAKLGIDSFSTEEMPET